MKLTASIGTAALILFTLIYLYGIYFRDIKDCGCFGRITLLNTSPTIVLARNTILMYLMVAIMVKCENKSVHSIPVYLVILCFECMAAFFSGHTYQHISSYNRITPVNLAESKLNRFITTSPDSTYLIFAFSYTCPHCLNSIENLKEYEKSKTVDKVMNCHVLMFSRHCPRKMNLILLQIFPRYHSGTSKESLSLQVV